MRRFLRKFRYGEKGFTLIELLVVVAILGVLAAVAVPNVGKFMERGQEEAALAELHNVQTAVLAGMADKVVSILPGGDGQPFHATADVTISGNFTVGQYIVGSDPGEPNVQYTYHIDADGSVTTP